MRSKLLNVDPPVTYAVVLDTGDEAMAEPGKFIRDNEVEAASLTAIGAFRRALLGYFDWQTKEYKKIAVEEQVPAGPRPRAEQRSCAGSLSARRSPP